MAKILTNAHLGEIPAIKPEENVSIHLAHFHALVRMDTLLDQTIPVIVSHPLTFGRKITTHLYDATDVLFC